MAEPQIEVWQRTTSGEDDDFSHYYYDVVEIIAGTDEIWDEQWNDDDGEAQLTTLNAS